MAVQFHPYSYILLLSAMISAAVGWLALRKRESLAMRSLAVMVSVLAIWSLCYAMVWLSNDLAVQVLWFKLMYLAVVTVPISYLILILDATRQSDWLTPRRLALLLVEPLLVLFALWTNDFHRLFITSVTQHSAGGFNSLVIARGPLYWLNVAYSYGLLLAAMIVLVRAFLRGAPLFLTQLQAFIIGASIPWIGNIVSLLRLSPFPGLDLTPVAFGITGLIYFYGLFRQGNYNLLVSTRSRLLEEISDGLVVLDRNFRLLHLNPAAERVLQVTAPDVVGRRAITVFPEWKDLKTAVLQLGGEFHTELPGWKDASRYYDVKVTPLGRNRGISGYLVLFRDITDSWSAAEQLRQANKELNERLQEIQALHRELRAQATRDPLTNLYNRRYLEESLEKELARAERKDNTVSVIMMDADKFKRINDLHGHKAGDQALQSLARIMLYHIRRSDIACRYGGEEFVIVMPNTAPEVAYERAEHIRRSFMEQDLFGPGTAGLTSLSIGIAAYPAAGRRGDEVLDAADHAMYAAKIAGGNRINIQNGPVQSHPALEAIYKAEQTSRAE